MSVFVGGLTSATLCSRPLRCLQTYVPTTAITVSVLAAFYDASVCLIDGAGGIMFWGWDARTLQLCVRRIGRPVLNGVQVTKRYRN